MKFKKRKIKYAARRPVLTVVFFLCWFALLVFLVDGVLKFQTPGIIQLAGEDMNMNPFEFSSLIETIFHELDLDISNDDAFYQYAL